MLPVVPTRTKFSLKTQMGRLQSGILSAKLGKKGSKSLNKGNKYLCIYKLFHIVNLLTSGPQKSFFQAGTFFHQLTENFYQECATLPAIQVLLPSSDDS